MTGKSKDNNAVNHNIDLSANDIAVVRTVVKNGHGWSLLPNYTVKEELKRGELAIIPCPKVKTLRFGVWWNRDKVHLRPHINKAIDWLANINLN